MPYKDPKKQAEYMRKYRTPYMHEYRRRKREQHKSDSWIAVKVRADLLDLGINIDELNWVEA